MKELDPGWLAWICSPKDPLGLTAIHEAWIAEQITWHRSRKEVEVLVAIELARSQYHENR